MPGKHLLLFAASLFFLVSARAQDEKGFNFPPGFGASETLVVIGPATSNKVTKGIIEAFEKEYNGRFESIEDRYGRNVQKDSAVQVYLLTVLEMPSAIKNTSDYKFGLRDLRTGRSYECDFWSGSYKKGAKYYAKHLEKFRKANGGR